MEQQFYAACHVDAAVVKASSSGGAFTAITDQWFSQYGKLAVVYGCAFDENLTAKHIRAETLEERNRMRGSKYIGSDMSGVFRMVERDLCCGKYALFSGTPCQIGGLKAFLKTKGMPCGDQLLTVEVVCHGVGSVRFFQDYLRTQERKYKGKTVSCSFRAKSRLGKKQDMYIRFDNGKKYNAASTKFDWFYSAYLRNLILRPSCYKCKYASRQRVADISIADCWGNTYDDLADRSVIVINTEKGAKWLGLARRDMAMKAISWEQIHQPHMLAPCKKPEDYDQFWKCYQEKGYLATQKFLGNHTIKGYLRSWAVEVLYRLHMIELIKVTRYYAKRAMRKF